MSGSSRVVQTASGPLTIAPADEALVDLLATRWPLPIATCLPREDAHTGHNQRATFLVPFEHEGRHINLIWLEQAPRGLREARAAVAATQAAADRLLLRVLRSGFPGLMVQMGTLRVDGERATPGVALVVGPGQRSRDDDPNPVRALLDAIREGELPFQAFDQPKYVPPSVAGELELGFGLLEGQVVLCFKPELDPSDPALARLVAGGVRALTHMPVVGTKFPQLGAPVPPPLAPRAELVAQTSPNGRRRIYRLVANLAACDGNVAPMERALLNGIAERFGLGPADTAALEREAFAGVELRIGREPAERELLVAMLIEMALADGVLEDDEVRRLRTFARNVGLTPEELDRRLALRAQERARSSEQAPPRPPADSPSAAQGQAGRAVLLDLPPGATLELNLLAARAGPGSCGFKDLPPGVYRLAVVLPDGRRGVHWARLAPGEVVVLAWDGRRLAPAESSRWTATQRRALAGELDGDLQAGAVHLPWRCLTAPMLAVPFPPAVYEAPEPRPRDPLAEVLVNHQGRAEAVLAEVAFSFLLGVLDGDPRGHARWRYLLQAFYALPAGVAARAPNTFAELVELLMDQQRQLPPELLATRSELTAGSHQLADRLIESGVPQLVEAGRRWAVFVAGHHPGAPAARELPRSLTHPHLEPHMVQLLDDYRAEIERLEREGGRLDPRLIFPVSNLGNFQGMFGDTLGAIASAERLLELGRTSGQSPEFLVTVLRRLARLNREVGRPDAARKAEREAEAIAGRN